MSCLLLDSFKEEMSRISADEFIVTAGTYNPSTGKNDPDTETWQSVGNCLFWEGSHAEGVVASKIRDKVDAVAVFYPTQNVTGKNLRITSGSSIKEYEIIAKPDNVAFDGEVLVCALKELT